MNLVRSNTGHVVAQSMWQHKIMTSSCGDDDVIGDDLVKKQQWELQTSQNKPFVQIAPKPLAFHCDRVYYY